MPSLIMERGKQKWQNRLGADFMSTGHFCFSCEQIFANRKCLEEHTCASASYICSCGTEFPQYKDMLEHSTTHEPGHQVLDHETIRKRRNEKRKEEEEKLKRIQKGEVVWKTPKSENVPSVSLPVKPILQFPNTSARMSQAPMKSAQISQVPELYPSLSQASLLSKATPLPTDMQNIFAGVGAPTVDLWSLYQPVVVMNTVRMYNKRKPYTCAKCGQGFMTKTSLITHHSLHVTDKVCGCIGCGLLLSSKKVMPRFHVCNSPNNATKFRLITAKPLGYTRLPEASTDKRLRLTQAAFLQLKNRNPNSSKASQTHYLSSTLQLKNLNSRSYNINNQGLHASPSLQFKRQNCSVYKPYTGVSFPSKSQSPRIFIQSSQRLPVTSSVQLKTPTNSPSGLLSKPAPTSSASNGLTCRVCHTPFETPQLLQRHKCAKAQEFMAQHVRGGRQHFKLKRMTPLASPNPAQMNGDRKLGFPPSGSMKNQLVAVTLENGPAVVPVNGSTEVESDDDCYIVESGPDKPAEMIYQVTSSVPIKT